MKKLIFILLVSLVLSSCYNVKQKIGKSYGGETRHYTYVIKNGSVEIGQYSLSLDEATCENIKANREKAEELIKQIKEIENCN